MKDIQTENKPSKAASGGQALRAWAQGLWQGLRQRACKAWPPMRAWVGRWSVPLIFVFYFIYLELVFRALVFGVSLRGWGLPVLFSAPFGLLAGVLAVAWKPKYNRALSLILTLGPALLYMTQYTYFRIFKQFLTVFSLTLGAGEVTQYWREALIGIFRSLPGLLALVAPFVLLCIFGKKLLDYEQKGARQIWKPLAFLGASVLAVVFVVFGTSRAQYSPYDLLFKTNSIQLSFSRIGVLPGCIIDLRWAGDDAAVDLSGLDQEPSQLPTAEAPASSAPAVSAPAPAQPVVDTTPNVLDIDFAALISEENPENVNALHSYFSAQTPSRKNQYTGMFAGYNLIYLTAESFSSLAVDPVLTPTLYKLVNEGFVFENFYNPSWGVSTSDGEYVNCTGLIPKSGVWSLYQAGVKGNALSYCLGNVFSQEGYTTRAYHNHTYDYYYRDVSHPNMGYVYKGVGNGLDTLTPSWPESDLEMMQATIPEYIDEARFHIYYMTVSGHMMYSFDGNAMATKNRALVEGLEMSEEAKAYLACNIELDRALAYLIGQLDAAGKLEETVLVMGADHYPYGLSDAALEELAGHAVEKNFEVYKSSLICWNVGMDAPVVVEKACSSLDILPTVLNLFGVTYDSRLLMGRDILSDAAPLVVFVDTSFITDQCAYNETTGAVTSFTDGEIDSGYLAAMKQVVYNKFKVSAAMLDTDYYARIGLPGAAAGATEN